MNGRAGEERMPVLKTISCGARFMFSDFFQDEARYRGPLSRQTLCRHAPTGEGTLTTNP